jgi:hypothetical protein
MHFFQGFRFSFRAAVLLSALLNFSCSVDESTWRQKVDDPKHLHLTMKAITDRIVFDIFSPPVASRIYAYSSVAAYEAGRHADSTLISLSGQLTNMPPMPQPEPGKIYSRLPQCRPYTRPAEH